MTSPAIWNSLRQIAEEAHRDADRATRSASALEACERELALTLADDKKKERVLREIMYRMEDQEEFADLYKLAREGLGLS